ncbi:MAG: DUF4973 domain-containing protein [Candidatus Pseudobacter hemicellulosilyticus]|uniref:DUF4973 domain-containing protein n=1 Tax=Candidatus Pseudobacter hemicellulosilyticus TaxID=3121375 RepID=A0AAJ6BGG7_9BACT|nr:MAG: DUF4973 domain-containing protein [Pseudobacter sp.]
MKKIFYLLIVAGLFMGTSCSKEWTKELYMQEVSFVRSGVTLVYPKYQSAGGSVTMRVPVVLSGSTTNGEDIQVTIAIDRDSLNALNFERFRLREDLYFRELPEANYTFESMTTTIPAGSIQGYFNLTLKLEGLDLVDKYMLPLKIVSTSKSNVSTRRWFSRTLMHIVPFNDFSGKYSNAGLIWNRDVAENNQTALTTPHRNAWVVDERTVFFYAGNIDEEAYDRRKYKVYATFNADSTVSLRADDPAIHFSHRAGSYTSQKEPDGVLPYLEITRITMNLEYWYSDITNPSFPINYRFVGPLTMERRRNTQIPEEDSQVLFE